MATVPYTTSPFLGEGPRSGGEVHVGEICHGQPSVRMVQAPSEQYSHKRRLHSPYQLLTLSYYQVFILDLKGFEG